MSMFETEVIGHNMTLHLTHPQDVPLLSLKLSGGLYNLLSVRLLQVSTMCKDL